MIDDTKELRQADDLAQAVASMIRQESSAGVLIEAAEMGHRLVSQNSDFPQAAALESLLTKTMDENEDIRELVTGDGSRYYFSTRFMTGAYATILLKKQGDSLTLIADIVRQNAADYRRPVPLDLFTQRPFDFTPDEILKVVEQMETLEVFQDIKRTTTSAFREFLYSTHVLEPMHASMLAEWLDVGQSENP
jgi:hypothetical protein